MNDLVSKDRPVFFIEIEEKHLRNHGASSKGLIERFMALNYTLLRIRTDWPTDHVALPNERGELLKRCLDQQKYRTDVLSGSNVELVFENQYYYSSCSTS